MKFISWKTMSLMINFNCFLGQKHLLDSEKNNFLKAGLFICLIIIYYNIFLHFFASMSSHIYIFAHFQIHDHFLSIVITLYLYIYVCIIYVTKCNLLHLYVLNCLFIFRADYLVLDTKVMCFYLGRIISPTLKFS